MDFGTLNPTALIQGSLAAPRRSLFTMLGTQWLAAPLWWVGPLWMLTVGIVVAWFAAPAEGIAGKLELGVLYGAVVMASGVAHFLGHLVSSRAAGASLYGQLLTPLLPINLYDDTPQPRRTHLLRAIGGPTANLAIAGVTALVALATGGNAIVWYVAILNVVIGCVALVPLSFLDGGVILRELRVGKSASRHFGS